MEKIFFLLVNKLKKFFNSYLIRGIIPTGLTINTGVSSDNEQDMERTPSPQIISEDWYKDPTNPYYKLRDKH